MVFDSTRVKVYINVGMLLGGRFVVGFAAGNYAVVQSYFSYATKPSQRLAVMSWNAGTTVVRARTCTSSAVYLLTLLCPLHSSLDWFHYWSSHCCCCVYQTQLSRWTYVVECVCVDVCCSQRLCVSLQRSGSMTRRCPDICQVIIVVHQSDVVFKFASILLVCSGGRVCSNGSAVVFGRCRTTIGLSSVTLLYSGGGSYVLFLTS